MQGWSDAKRHRSCGHHSCCVRVKVRMLFWNVCTSNCTTCRSSWVCLVCLVVSLSFWACMRFWNFSESHTSSFVGFFMCNHVFGTVIDTDVDFVVVVCICTFSHWCFRPLSDVLGSSSHDHCDGLAGPDSLMARQ